MNLTIGYCTSRKESKLEWFTDSLRAQIHNDDWPQIIVVDTHCKAMVQESKYLFTPPKPTVWQGEHRLTKQDWWAASNSRNTALCLCKTDYIVWVDDRCVLTPTWLKAAQEAAAGGYAVAGSYEKRHNMKVENGVITDLGKLDGSDPRSPNGSDSRAIHTQVKSRAPGAWYFGGSMGMPVEFALTINGFDEMMDGLGMEDCMAGLHLEANGFPIMYDPNLKIVEDRTPSEIGEPMKRSSKEKHPKDVTDKGHEALRRFSRLKRASHHWNLRAIKSNCAVGMPFPGIDKNNKFYDWFDGQDISTM